MSCKKIFLIAIVAFLSLQQTFADTTLVVEKTNGTTETFLLSNKPQLTFGSENCTFSISNKTVTIPRTDIDYIHFVDSSTGIESQKVGGDVQVRFSGENTVVISGLKNNRITVLDISGKAVNADISNSGEDTTVSLNSLSRGIYIIKYGNNSIKIMKK